MDRAAAISELVIANRVVAHLKLVDSFGHVTVRNPENPQGFFMSRARAPRLVTKEDILEFDLDSAPVDLRGLKPYSERFIHGCLYKSRPDVIAICHNHAHELLPLAVTKTVMRPALHSAAVIGHVVPVWDIRDEFGDTNMLVTSNEMGNSLAAAVGKGKAALMRGHGSVVVGANIQDAVFTTFYLRLNAEIMIKAMSMGETITYLSPGEVDRSGELHSQPAAQGRAWEDWCSQAGIEYLASK
ncbi:MAG TPA: class II aldolase/adducin family protein [Candidatus Saccharimonadales bacterium]|nr:class II aldolase/adducin family protein [Candidatus Saccharimonadales bacterium]